MVCRAHFVAFFAWRHRSKSITRFSCCRSIRSHSFSALSLSTYLLPPNASPSTASNFFPPLMWCTFASAHPNNYYILLHPKIDRRTALALSTRIFRSQLTKSRPHSSHLLRFRACSTFAAMQTRPATESRCNKRPVAMETSSSARLHTTNLTK